jgi:L-asparaginase
MPNRDRIALVIAGGEVGMQFSEKQNGHKPSLSGEDIRKWIPEDFASNLEIVDWSHQPSSHYTMRMTTDLVHILNNLVRDGIAGIVVVCGTDTIEEMAYLTDLLWAYPQPLVFTGSILPPDMTGSDASINLIQAINVAHSQACWGLGVLVCFQDQLFAASEVTQINNHRRAAFAALDRGPVAEIIGEDVEILRAYKRGKILEGDFSPARNVEILWACLGASDRMLSSIVSEKGNLVDGLVIAGFGNGNVPPNWTLHIKNLLKSGIPVVLTSRCMKGHVRRMFSYEGSVNKLLDSGAIDGGNLNPLQARLKLSVGIGAGLEGEELQKYMLGKY